MNKFPKSLNFILLAVILFSCASKRSTSSFQGECFVVISQSGKAQKLSDGSKTIELQRKNFNLRWWGRTLFFRRQLA
jgi:hypothetical protein